MMKLSKKLRFQTNLIQVSLVIIIYFFKLLILFIIPTKYLLLELFQPATTDKEFI